MAVLLEFHIHAVLFPSVIRQRWDSLTLLPLSAHPSPKVQYSVPKFHTTILRAPASITIVETAGFPNYEGFRAAMSFALCVVMWALAARAVASRLWAW